MDDIQVGDIQVGDVQVKDVMSDLVITVSPDDSILEAARQMARNSVSGVPVVVGRQAVGMVSESDVVWALTPEPEREAGMTLLDFMLRSQSETGKIGQRGSVRDIMSRAVIDISPFASIWKAASVMHSHGVKRLPVTDHDGRLVGIVSRADLVQAIAHGNRLIADFKQAIGAPEQTGPAQEPGVPANSAQHY